MPLLTVITPCKNHVDGMRIASESLGRQTFTDWEHLVMDAASTDGTMEYCRSRPQTTIISERDAGVEDALNKGLRLAKGKYVTFLLCFDALIDPEWLQTAVTFLEENPDYSMASACSGNKVTDITYNYDAFPSGLKFNYYFFITPWPIINETACVCSLSSLLEQFLDVRVSDPKREIFFRSWINFFGAGYLARFFPRAVVSNDSHHGSLIEEALKTGEFKIKEHDFLDAKREIKQGIINGQHPMIFKDQKGHPLQISFSKIKFLAALFCYKFSLFFVKKIQRRKIPKMQYDYCQRLCRKCVDFVFGK